MSNDYKACDISLAEATALTEITYPNPPPHPDVTLLIVAYNEAQRELTCPTSCGDRRERRFQIRLAST